MADKRRAKTSATFADSESADSGLPCDNLSIEKLQVLKFGRSENNVLEPTELSIGRVYKVQWKKEKPNLEEIARLYWVDGLTQRQIAEMVGIRRKKIGESARKYKNSF